MRVSMAVFLFLLVAACTSADATSSYNSGKSDPLILPPTEISEPNSSPRIEVPDLSADLRLENYGLAPELTNQIWLNTDQPLRLEDLRGQVVLLDMWTFG